MSVWQDAVAGRSKPRPYKVERAVVMQI